MFLFNPIMNKQMKLARDAPRLSQQVSQCRLRADELIPPQHDVKNVASIHTRIFKCLFQIFNNLILAFTCQRKKGRKKKRENSNIYFN